MPRDSENLPSVIRRMTAGQMLLDGVPREDVAARLNLSAQTVRRYLAHVEAGGLDALKGLSVGGRSSVLDPETRAWIAAALCNSASRYGFDSDAWTNSRLRALIEARVGVRFSRVYVWQIATNLGLGHRLSKSRR